MALQLPDVQKLLTEIGLNCFRDADRGILWFGNRGENGTYQVLVMVDMEGTFLQFRAMQYATCPSNHPNCGALLRLLGKTNYLKRLIKFGWDDNDGEVTAYADVVIGDGGLSQGQLLPILGFFLMGLDELYPRIQGVIRTGQEPDQGPVRMPLGGGS